MIMYFHLVWERGIAPNLHIFLGDFLKC